MRVEQIAGLSRDDDLVGPESPTKARNDRLKRIRRITREILTPEPIDQAIHRDRLAGMDREFCQDSAFPVPG
jgi:hypothetical protein